MIIGDLCLLSEVFRKIKISDDCISRKTFFLKEKKMFFSEILKFGTNKIYFYFAMEDFFDEMSKKCIIIRRKNK